MNRKFALNILCFLLFVGAPSPALSQTPAVSKENSQSDDTISISPAPKSIEDNNLIHSPLPLPAEPVNKVKAQPPRQVDLTSKRREVPTVTYGVPSWAIGRPKRTIPTGAPITTTGAPAATNETPLTTSGTPVITTGEKKLALVAPGLPVPSKGTPQNTAGTRSLIEKADVNGNELEQRTPEPYTTLNIRVLVPHEKQAVDVIYAYPYPVKPPPLSGATQPLPSKPKDLKPMILAAGYSDRIDFNRPYPNYGWRWVHAFYRAHTRSGLGWPHSMITMYRWVDEMMPYVLAEVKKSNSEEGDRISRHMKFTEEFESTHVEAENQATLNGLVPIQIKTNSKAIGQTKLTTGNWWITATRKVPGLKLFWEIPVTCHAGETINIQLTEANALIIQGGW